MDEEDYEGALREAMKAVEIAEKIFPSPSWEQGDSYLILTEVYVKLDRFRDVLEASIKAANIYSETVGANDWRVLIVRIALRPARPSR